MAVSTVRHLIHRTPGAGTTIYLAQPQWTEGHVGKHAKMQCNIQVDKGPNDTPPAMQFLCYVPIHVRAICLSTPRPRTSHMMLVTSGLYAMYKNIYVKII